MADNIELNAGSGGATLATDDVSGVHYQVVKLAVGADGSANLVANANPIPISDAGGSITVDGTFWQTTQPVSIASVPSHDVTNAGTFSVQISNTPAVSQSGTWNITNISGTVSLPTGASTAANQATLIGHVDGIETLLGTIDTDTGALAACVAGSEVQTDIVAALPAGTNLIGNVGIGVRTSGGTSVFRSLDLDESEEEVKGSAGQLYWIHAMNLSATKKYLKVYDNTAAGTTVGSTTPLLTFPLGTTGDTNGAGFVFALPMGIPFSTGITVAATTGVADSDTGAPGANEVVVNIGYA